MVDTLRTLSKNLIIFAVNLPPWKYQAKPLAAKGSNIHCATDLIIFPEEYSRKLLNIVDIIILDFWSPWFFPFSWQLIQFGTRSLFHLLDDSCVKRARDLYTSCFLVKRKFWRHLSEVVIDELMTDFRMILFFFYLTHSYAREWFSYTFVRSYLKLL